MIGVLITDQAKRMQVARMLVVRLRRYKSNEEAIEIPSIAAVAYPTTLLLAAPAFQFLMPLAPPVPWLILLIPEVLFFGVICTVIMMAVFLTQYFPDKAPRRLLWAWEAQQDKAYIKKFRGLARRQTLVRSLSFVLAVAATATCFALLVQFGDYVIVAVLVWPLFAALLSLLTSALLTTTEYLSLPQHRTRLRGMSPLDRSVLNLLNLAYYSHIKAGEWSDPEVRAFMLERIEEAARTAESEFPGSEGRLTRLPVATRNALSELNLAIAQGFRAHATVVTTSMSKLDFLAMRDSFVRALAAIAAGDLNAISGMRGASRSRLRRVSAISRQLAPTLILALAAIFVPRISLLSLDPQAQQSLTLALMLPAALSVFTLLGADASKAGDTIQRAIERVSGPRQ